MTEELKHRTVAFLRKTERYTRLDMVYFASGSFWSTFGQLASSVLAFGLTLVFANYLSKDVYGTYRYLLSLAGIMNVFTLTGMSQAVAQAVAVGHEGALRTSVRYQLKWNLVLMFLLMGLGSYYLFHENFEYTRALLILALATPFSAAFNTWGAYLGGKREFRLATLYGVASSLVYIGGMTAAVFFGKTTLWLIAAYAAATTIANIVCYILVIRRFHPPLEKAEDTLRFGKRLSFIGLMSPIAGQVDKIILNHFYGPAALAVYAMAIAVPDRLIPLFKKWVDVGFPKIAQKTATEINRTFYLRLGQGLLAGLLFGAGWILMAPFFFRFLMPKYLEAITYAQIFGLSFVFALPNRYISVLLNSQKMVRSILINETGQNILRIGLYALFGIPGGILGLVIAQNVYNGLSLLINIFVWRYSARQTA